jgi:hypothetical protein
MGDQTCQTDKIKRLKTFGRCSLPSHRLGAWGERAASPLHWITHPRAELEPSHGLHQCCSEALPLASSTFLIDEASVQSERPSAHGYGGQRSSSTMSVRCLISVSPACSCEPSPQHPLAQRSLVYRLTWGSGAAAFHSHATLVGCGDLKRR